MVFEQERSPSTDPLLPRLAERLGKRVDRVDFYGDLATINSGDALTQPEVLVELIEDYVRNPYNRIAGDYLSGIREFLDICDLDAIKPSRIGSLVDGLLKERSSVADPETRETMLEVTEDIRSRDSSSSPDSQRISCRPGKFEHHPIHLTNFAKL